MTELTPGQAVTSLWGWERWRKPIWLGLIVLNFILVVRVITWPDWQSGGDVKTWAEIDLSNPYALSPTGWMPFRYSPVAAWILQSLAIAVGPVGFIVGHVLALLALPRGRGLIVGLSFPFWFDLLWGNVFTLVFVAAYWAMRGNRAGTLAFLVLTILMPRPVQAPLLLWLLWQQPWARLPFVVLMAGHAAIVLASGLATDWLYVLTSTTADEANLGSNFGPTRLFGSAWLVVGIPLAVYLFRKHPGLAGLALAPYVLGQYWLLAFLPTVPATARYGVSSRVGGAGRGRARRMARTVRRRLESARSRLVRAATRGTSEDPRP
jgi:hypothetical protein